MSAVVWTAQDAAAATGGELIGGQWSALGVSIDTRTLDSGDLFIALPGAQADGHEFVASAFARGAAAAVVSEDVPDAPGPFLRVGDVRRALDDLGRAARARSGARIVAVTGSVGKTGIKEALRLALGRGRLTHASAASYNNDIGVPLSLARMPADAEFGVFELGMNHPGELTALSEMVRPHVALVTNVEEAHREFFSSIEAIADAKAEVFAGLEAGGIAVLNRDNRHFERLAAAARTAGAARIVSFGFAEDADARVVKFALHEDCSAATAVVGTERLLYKVGVPGRHWVTNSLAVLLTVQEMGGDVGLAALALGDMMPVKGRGQRHKIPLSSNSHFWLVDESYNANPASMRAALETLGNFNIECVEGQRGATRRVRGRRIAVIGDMRELGEGGPKMHAALAAVIQNSDIDLVVTVGELMDNLRRALPANMLIAHVRSAAEAAELMRAEVRPHDVVMVKGSLSMGMARVVSDLAALGQSADGRRASG